LPGCGLGRFDDKREKPTQTSNEGEGLAFILNGGLRPVPKKNYSKNKLVEGRTKAAILKGKVLGVEDCEVRGRRGQSHSYLQ